ncbi:MAG: CBS domain-containing protein [Acidobacteria bacterium]|nr:CBS domain-containing protein [Acidobacteriota bacterium]
MVEVPTVRKSMKSAKKTLKVTDDMGRALRVLIGEHFPAIPVVDADKHVVGILSEKDCLRTICRWANEQIAGGTVGDHMSPLIHTVKPDMDILAAAAEFLTCNFVSLPVVEKGRLVGTISRQDVLTSVRDWHQAQDQELERLHAAKSGHERPSTIAEMQRTLGSHTREQLASIFKSR